MKKLTIEFIRCKFEEEKYVLLSTEYKGCDYKLSYQCVNGHKHATSWSNWRRGKRCPYCYGNVRLTTEFIRSEFEKENYRLLTSKYINCKQKLEYICSKGHKHYTIWINWIKGSRCPSCARKAKPTIEFVKSKFEEIGYVLLTTQYKNCKQKLRYICNNGHRTSICWSSFVAGNRCAYCANNIKKTIDFIKKQFKEEGYVFLTTEYKGAHQKLKFICPRGHESEISWTKWQIGHRCWLCYKEDNIGSAHPSWKGGIACEPYSPEFNSKLKKSILERDNYQCQNPDCWGTYERLSIHHIDYNKKNCDPSNLIILCISCNSRANVNRDYWIKFYQKIMNEKYGYVYERTVEQGA